jgi:hypothetical protein
MINHLAGQRRLAGTAASVSMCPRDPTATPWSSDSGPWIQQRCCGRQIRPTGIWELIGCPSLPLDGCLYGLVDDVADRLGQRLNRIIHRGTLHPCPTGSFCSPVGLLRLG